MLWIEFSSHVCACQYPKNRDESLAVRNVVTTFEGEVSKKQ